MIRKILIKNLILIDYAEVEFSPHLNIITGESGSGKSALLSALGLVLGRKATAEIIRKEADMAWAEAFFTLPEGSEAEKLLQEEGLAFSPSSTLSIRREISRSGKTRCFIGEELTNAAFLRLLGAKLMQMADQNSHTDLSSESYQRNLLDLFAQIKHQLLSFKASFEEEKKVRSLLHNLIEEEGKKAREREKIEMSLQEIAAAKLQEGEEESLSQEHHLLAHAQEIQEKIQTIHSGLQDNPHPILAKLARFTSMLKPLAPIHPRFAESYELVKNAHLELDEAARLLLLSKGQFDVQPARMQAIEERLQVVESLKKKYGENYEKIVETRRSLEKIQQAHEKEGEERELLQTRLLSLESANNALCREIHTQRRSSAKDFQEKISTELMALNLSQSRFQIELQPLPRTSHGEDGVAFLFSANANEALQQASASASGGELSRLMLAIQSVLAANGDAPTLIFDEIDANVGGKTASMIGEKLQQLGKYRQIICVTHFVQVAKCADLHILVQKGEKEGRVSTTVTVLDKTAQSQEFNRMVGITS